MPRALSHFRCNRAHPPHPKKQGVRNNALARASLALEACLLELQAARKRVAELEARLFTLEYEREHQQRQ